MHKSDQHTRVMFHKRNLFPFVALMFMAFACFAQSKVTSKIDTASIKIGEQIQYTITVETDSTDIVYFPEDQTFSPLEMVEALKIDTTKNKDRITLQRIYALTQFDSGQYTIPPQRIGINEKPYLTDSFRIRVADVPVDTTKQKMFDIKPLIKVERSYAKLWKTLLWVLLGLAIMGSLVYWFFLRKKPLTKEEKVALLPPFERAMLQLKELENSKYLIHDEHKKYYSELTNIVRSYLEEDAHISALESTTDQLIEKLSLVKDAGELDLEDETIEQFKKVLQTADLVKFAKSKPSNAIAEQDRSVVEQLVTKTKDALPEPAEEELLLNEEYLEGLAKKKQKKRIKIAAAIFGFSIFLGIGAVFALYGYKQVKDTVIGHPTKELLEGEWVQSTYGFPPIEIETPQVLIREEREITGKAAEVVASNQTFVNGLVKGFLSISANSTTYKEPVKIDFQKLVDANLANFEQMGVKNIIPKEEDFFTKSGVQGLKVYGSGIFSHPDIKEKVKIDYVIICFGGDGFTQQIVIYHESGDEYAEQIVDRVLASVDVKTQV